jgi:hypothetical protein
MRKMAVNKPASDSAIFDDHQVDPAKLQAEVREDAGYRDRVMTYMGRIIRITRAQYAYGYVVTVDDFPIQGNFPGVYTAFDRAKHMIDKGRV